MEVIFDYFLKNKIYLLALPGIIGFISWRRLAFEYRLFVILLIYSFLNAVFKIYYGKFIDIGNNRILSNIYNIVFFNFLLWLFYRNINLPYFKKIIKSIALVYGLSIIYEIEFENLNYHTQTQVKSYIFGGLGILLCITYYFIQLLTSDKKETVFSNLMLWIAIAYFIYFLGFMPFKIGENYFVSKKELVELSYLKRPIVIFKDIILCIGFICNRQKIQS